MADVGVGRIVIVGAVKLEGRWVCRLELSNAAEKLLGGVDVLEALPVQHRDLQEHADFGLFARTAASRLEGPGVEHDQRRPVLVSLIGVCEQTECARIARIDVYDLLHRLDSAQPLPKWTRCELGETDERRDALALLGSRIDPALEVLGEIGPLLTTTIESLEVVGGARVGLIDLEGLAQILVDVGGIWLVARERLGDGKVERSGSARDRSKPWLRLGTSRRSRASSRERVRDARACPMRLRHPGAA